MMKFLGKTRLLIALGVAAAPAAGAAGWLTASPGGGEVASALQGAPPLPVVRHQSEYLSDAVTNLKARLPAVIQEDETGLTEAAMMPEMAVEVALRSRLLAVLGKGRSYQILVSPEVPGEGSFRLSVGDPFLDGWSVSQISPQQVILQRADETALLSLFDPASGADEGGNWAGVTDQDLILRYSQAGGP